MDPRQQDIFTFVNEKLKIDDVEPMYTAIVRSRLPQSTRQKLCFAEGLADHLGLAARMAEAPDFWRATNEYVSQGQRGGARRHFRGATAKAALKTMEKRFADLGSFFSNLPTDFFEARRFITELPQFGPFSAFKIADMAERTCDAVVDFSAVRLSDFAKFPKRGAALAAEYLGGGATPESVYASMLNHHWNRKAPPHYDRPLNAQEIETMFCNYGHSKWHPPGYEASELRKLLLGYGKLAEKLERNLSKGLDA